MGVSPRWNISSGANAEFSNSSFGKVGDCKTYATTFAGAVRRSQRERVVAMLSVRSRQVSVDTLSVSTRSPFGDDWFPLKFVTKCNVCPTSAHSAETDRQVRQGVYVPRWSQKRGVCSLQIFKGGMTCWGRKDQLNRPTKCERIWNSLSHFLTYFVSETRFSAIRSF